MYNSPEAINYRETGIAASLDNPGVLPTAPAPSEEGGAENAETNNNNQQVTTADIQQLYRQFLGGEGQGEYVQNWAAAERLWKKLGN